MALTCPNCGKSIDIFSNGGALAGTKSIPCCRACMKLYMKALEKFPLESDLVEKHREELRNMGLNNDGLLYLEQSVKFRTRETGSEVNTSAPTGVQSIKDITELAQREGRGAIYHIKGSRGREIEVFPDKAVITTNVTLGSLITHNATDGSKTIYYSDVIGVQYKKPGVTLGYLQLETASTSMNNKSSNFFNENSFTFDTIVVHPTVMDEVYAYIMERVEAIKHGSHHAAPAISAADEIKKFKELLDIGAITQEEFDAKKKQLLGL